MNTEMFSMWAVLLDTDGRPFEATIKLHHRIFVVNIQSNAMYVS